MFKPRNILHTLTVRNKSVQLPTSADNVTLLAFAAVRRAAATSIDISCPPGPQQQTRRTLVQRPIDGTDRRTDGVRTYKRGTFNRGTVKRGQLIAGQLIARTHNRADT